MFLLSAPQATTIPSNLLVIAANVRPLLATSYLLRSEATNCNGCAAKKKPGTIKLYKKLRSTMPDAASRAMMMGWWIR